MRNRLLVLGLGWLLLLGGCPTDDDDDAADDDVGDDDTADDDDDSADDDTGDDDTAVGPCADGGWGFVTDPAAAIHVRDDGSDDTGDGSVGAPFASLEAALEASRIKGAVKQIAVGPGSFATTLNLFGVTNDGGTDHGLLIEACGPDETTLSGADGNAPVIKVSGASGVRLAGFETDGGRRALWVWGGTPDTVDVSMVSVHVRNSIRLGVIFGGSDTLVELDDVIVEDTVVETDGLVEYGYGISVQDASMVMTGGGVYDSHRIGVMAHLADIELHGVAIEGTTSDGQGHLGRGLQLQDLSTAVVDGCTLADNADAALFSLRSFNVELTNTDISATAAATIPDQPETSGDGVVISQGDLGNPVEYFQATLTDNTIDGSARAGVVLEAITATLDGNVCTNNGLEQQGYSMFTQSGAVVSGADPVVDLQTPLGLLSELVEIDDLVD